MTPTVRPYRTADRSRVRGIAVATAFLGDLPARALGDPELTADLLTAYYTDGEPASAFVAEGEEGVVGYLLGAVSTARYAAGMRRLVLRRILPSLLLGGYRPGRVGFRLGAVALWGVLGDRRLPDFEKDYPAHLHINLDASRRGERAGSLLIEAWLNRLRGLGVGGVHLSTTSAQPAAARFFSRHGFRTVFRAHSTLWSYLVGEAVSREIMARSLL